MTPLALGLGLSRNRSRGQAFSLASLFANGKLGGLFDPSDLTTMFQDAAGTIPANQPGHQVRRMLDKSKWGGKTLEQVLAGQAELVTNGTFDTNITGWGANIGTASWVDGRLRLNITSTNARTVGQPFNVLEWVTYRISGKISNLVSGASGPFIRLSSNSTGQAERAISSTGEGDKVFYWRATYNGYAWPVVLTLGASGSCDFDDISIKPVPGNHVLAPTDAARPVLGREPRTGRRNLLLATDTLSTQSRTVTAAQHTLSFRGTGTVTLSGASTSGPLVGTGAGDIVSLTFTPTAGSLTLTVSGTVEIAQLELGASRSAYQSVTTQWDVTEAGVPDVWYLFFDGVDDLMEGTSLAGWGAPFYLGAVIAAAGFVESTLYTSTFGPYTNGSHRADFALRQSGGDVGQARIHVRQGGGTQTAASGGDTDFSDRKPHLASGGFQAGQVFIEHDGTLRQTVARAITNTFSSPFRIGQGANAPIKFYGGAYVVDELTAAQQMLVKQFYANRMGIAL